MFDTQRIANNYPLNSRIRQDPSSLGFRMFSIQGEFIEKYVKDLIRFKVSQYPLTSFTDQTKDIVIWDISDFEFTYEDDELNRFIISPIVKGDGIELDIVNETVDLLYALPSTLAFSSTISNYDAVVYDSDISDTGVINDIEVAGHLYLEITNATRFINVTDAAKERSPVLRAQIHLEGEDANGNEIIENLFPIYNGIYRTVNRYSKLLVIETINIQGDNAHLTIKSLDFDTTSYRSLYHNTVTPELQSELLKEFDDNFFYLKYPIFPVEAGTRVNEDKETITAFALYDSEDNRLEIDDITFVQNTEDMIVLSNDKIYFFKSWLPNLFQTTVNERSREIIVTIEPLTRYPTLDTEIKCFFYTRSIFKKIDTVTIKLIDPDGEIFYLNDNFELQESSFTFLGDVAEWPADTFSDKTFLFTPDKAGQWEFVTSVIDTDGDEYNDVSCLFVPFLTPDKELTLDEIYESISYGEDGKLYCFDGTDTDIYEFSYNVCLIASEDGKVFTREDYDELEVVYE